MAIVISGVNNNDKITASDGTIDLLSGVNFNSELTVPSFKVGNDIQIGNAGIITATTYIGNLTGNVNATSNLLLQIGGSEKFRVGSSGQLGIGGANYGTSGQVLTSGGSGSAATWSTISGTTINTNADNRLITGSGTANTLNGEANLTFDGTTLQVENSGSGLRNLLRLKNSNASAGVSGLYFNSTTSGTAFDAACVRNGVNGSGQGRLYLQTNNGSGLVTNLNIEYDGQVSIPTNSLNIIDSIVHIGDTNTKIRFPAADTITAETAGSERLRIDSYGLVTAPFQYHLHADRTGNQTGYNAGGDFGTPMIFNQIVSETKDSSLNSCFNTSNGIFTAPVTGLYLFNASVYTSSSGNIFSQSWFTLNGGRCSGTDWVINSGYAFVQNTQVIRLAAGNTVGFKPYAGGQSNVTLSANNNHTYFKVTLIG